MALDTTPIVPVNDPNCLNVANAASKVYPPLATTTTLANDVGSGEQILRNQTHTLSERKVERAGDTMTGALTINADFQIQSGQTFVANGVTISGVVTFAASGRAKLDGRKQLVRARVALSDASQDVDVSQGDRFTLNASPAAPRTITLKSTGVVPQVGEALAFFWNPGATGVTGTKYTFQREDTTVVATFVGAGVANTGAVFAEFEYTSGGWRLGPHSGTPNEYVPPAPGPESWDQYGVIPGAGA